MGEEHAVKPQSADAESDREVVSSVPPPRLSLAEREALLSEAERIAHLGSWVWDVSRNEVTWSDELFQILGLDSTRDGADVDAFFAAIHAEDVERVRRISARCLETRISVPIDFRVVRPDGVVRFVHMEGDISDSPSGSTRAVGTVLDVTDRERARHELERNEYLLREAQRIAHVGSWRWDVRTNQLEWSDELRRIAEVATDDQASLDGFFSLVHEEDRASVIALVDRIARTGSAEPAEFRLRTRTGVEKQISMNCAAIRDGQGTIDAFLGVAHDITRVRQLEEQLSNSRKMEAIGRMAGGVAHDFNNLLTVIAGHVSLMRSRKDHSGLDAIEHAVAAAAELTRQLLTVGGQTKLKPQPLNVNAVARDTLEFLSYSLGETIELRFNPEPDLWPAHVDPGALERVLINLVVNARDAMPEGGVLTVGTRNFQAEIVDPTGSSSNARHVLLLVEDTGIGMDASTRARIFEPFFTTKQPGKGTGLGLSAVYGLVTQSGGLIDVTSAPGKGTRFEVRLQPAR